MVLITRNVAKGVPPRLHYPKPKAKPCTQKDNPKTKSKAKGSRKRVVVSDKERDDTEEEDSDEVSSSSDESVEKAKKKKRKRRRVASDSDSEEVETIDQDVEPAEKQVEEVDDGASQQGDEQEGDGLNDHQRGPELEEKPARKDSTLDLLTIMTDKVIVNFKVAADTFETERGRWCTICKEDANFIRSNGKRKAFHKGGNSSCRAHVRRHYSLYKDRCEKAKIPINHWAIPREIWKVMEEEKEASKRG
ncbi:hypothetical protein BGW80DRAFT_1439430 [Lactifluus volemus]|nr:hypothetical protein BGW80DRAFT_1440000 [Lactifluus volemus]KAH9955954.1 hypothetical protein BGW80DRAFT_1439430 [Lactifluus volemus]